MENNTDKIKFYAIAVFVLQVLVLVVLQFIFKQPFSLVAVMFTAPLMDTEPSAVSLLAPMPTPSVLLARITPP